MKTSVLLGLFSVASAVTLNAERGGNFPPPPAPQPPPPVSTVQITSAPAVATYVYEQRPMGGRTYLVTPDQAQAVMARFKEAYAKAGSPRLLIYVNRELVDEQSGLKLSARTEHVETTRNSDAAKVSETQKATHKNTYRIRDRKEAALADRQTVRDVERLFGRPLRMGGAAVVDQRVAAQMLAGKSVENLTTHADSEQARRDREAIAKTADIVIEVLVSSRSMTVPGISGDQVVSVPDIQATAIRLSDAKILGQATAADLLNRAGVHAQYHDVREVTEATALSLMEDMAL